MNVFDCIVFTKYYNELYAIRNGPFIIEPVELLQTENRCIIYTQIIDVPILCVCTFVYRYNVSYNSN